MSDFRDPWYDEFKRRIDKAQHLHETGYDDDDEDETPPPLCWMLQQAPQQALPMVKWRCTKTTYVGGRRREWVSELLGVVEASSQQEASRIAREKFGVSWDDEATLWVERLVAG